MSDCEASTIQKIREDIGAHCGAKSALLPVLLWVKPSLAMLLWWRLAMALHQHGGRGGRFAARVIRAHVLVRYSCDLSPAARVGRRLRMPHPIGIVIGDGVHIGDDVALWQHVTLGSHGRLQSDERDYPQLGHGVRVYSGATVIGGISLGDGSVVAAQALVNRDVPAQSLAVGLPARTAPLDEANEGQQMVAPC